MLEHGGRGMSKRLTQRNEKGEAYGQLYADPDRVAEVIVEQAKKEKEVIERLAYYEDLEEQGKLIELPCAVGTKVYCIHRTPTKPAIACTIADEFILTLCILEGRFGKTVFLTQEVAEAALKEREQE